MAESTCGREEQEAVEMINKVKRDTIRTKRVAAAGCPSGVTNVFTSGRRTEGDDDDVDDDDDDDNNNDDNDQLI